MQWEKKMYIDHDLEIVHPWHYATYLLEDDIRLSFTPAKKSAMFRIDFPAGTAKHLFIRGSDDLKGYSAPEGVFRLEDKIRYKPRGLNAVPREMQVFVFAQLTDSGGNAVKGARMDWNKDRFSVQLPEDAPSSILVKYAISYISHEQAEYNFQEGVGR